MSSRARAVSGNPNSARLPFAVIALAIAALALASCSGGVDMMVRADASARFAVRLEIPDALSQRVRQFGQIPAGSPLFDAPGVRKEFGVRKSIHLIDVAVPDGDSMTSVLWIPDLVAFSQDRSLAPAGMVGYGRKGAEAGAGGSAGLAGGTELRVRLSRDNAAAAFALFPGMDRDLVDALSPPALEKDPVTSAEYRANLESVIIGKKLMPAFDACAVAITLNAPKPIVGAGGGSASGQVFKARIPLFDLLTLEKPVEFWVRWAE